MTFFSVTFFIFILLPIVHLYILVCHAREKNQDIEDQIQSKRCAVLIPAHNEEEVITQTIKSIQNQYYPNDLVDIYIVADHCTDRTALVARGERIAGCWERQDSPSGSKGAALNWLLERVWGTGINYYAVIFFDADSCPDKFFMTRLVRQLKPANPIVQGCVQVSNPHDGWYPKLNWAIETVDKRLNQIPRRNLGLSAKISGYGFGILSSFITDHPFSTGLTEDYEYRLQLLGEGINVFYEPGAEVSSEAALNWNIGKHQHARWRKGIYKSRRRFRVELFRLVLKKPDPALVDALLQTLFPSYSTLIILVFVGFLIQIALIFLTGLYNLYWLIIVWGIAFGLLLLYPIIGLSLEHAPGWAYMAVFSGPFFVGLRTWQAIQSRFFGKKIGWVPIVRRGGKAE